MTEDKNTQKKEEVKPAENTDKKDALASSAPKDGKAVQAAKVDTNKGAQKAVAKSVFGGKRMAKKNFKKGPRDKAKDEFDQRILDLARVTRVMAGGKRMRFRATVVVGDKKSKVGIGVGKGLDVAIAVNKAVNEAKKNLIEVPIVNDTIPHEVYKKHGAAKLMFRPAKKGRGVIAGGVVRVILELSGIKNITSKILGTNSKLNNAKCTIEALKALKKVEQKKQATKNVKKSAKKAEGKSEAIKQNKESTSAKASVDKE